MSIESNRRDFFRIDDEVYLRVQKLDIDSQLIQKKHEATRQEISVRSNFQMQRNEMQPVLKQIRSKNLAVASYLESLDDQMELLASRVLGTSIFVKGEPLASINISASGMEFKNNIEVEKGDMLEVILQLFPEESYVAIVGEVIRSIPVAQGNNNEPSDALNSISLCFKHVHKDDTEVIVRHIHYLQRLQLQHRREA